MVLTLINSYVSKGLEYVTQLAEEYATQNPLGDWHEGLIPSTGHLRNGTSFRFHGVGCRFVANGKIVDVDFGESVRNIGFDAWRLYLYQRNEDRVISMEEIASELETLHSQGVISKRDRLVPHLFFLTGNRGQ